MPDRVVTSGTGLVVCRVCGLTPSGSSITSAFPWSAVTSVTPSPSRTASSTRPRQRSTVSTAATVAGIDPVWPTMSGFAKLTTANRYPLPDLVAKPVGDLVGGHLGLAVVARHVTRRGHEDSLLPLPLPLLPAVQEVSHVRVLLRLRDVELARSRLREHLGERVLHDLLREGDRAVEVVLILGHRGELDSGLEQLLRELPSAIGAEVEEDRGVLGAEPWPSVEDDRLDELVGHVVGVARADGLDRIVRLLPLRPRGSRRAPSPFGPSVGRDPWRSSGRTPWRCGPREARRARALPHAETRRGRP